MRRKRIADEQPEVAPEQTGSGTRNGNDATPEAAAAEAARCAYVRPTRRRKWRRRRPEVEAAIADYGTDDVLKGIFAWGILGGGEGGLKEPGSAACGGRMWRMRSADNALKPRKGNKSGFEGEKGGVGAITEYSACAVPIVPLHCVFGARMEVRQCPDAAHAQ